MSQERQSWEEFIQFMFQGKHTILFGELNILLHSSVLLIYTISK